MPVGLVVIQVLALVDGAQLQDANARRALGGIAGAPSLRPLCLLRLRVRVGGRGREREEGGWLSDEGSLLGEGGLDGGGGHLAR